MIRLPRLSAARTTILILVALAASLMTASAAHAVYTTITYYGDRGYAQVTSAYRVKACDTRVDGRRVYSTYQLSNGYWYVTYWAPSGGCTSKTHSIPVENFAVCVEGLGCGYRYANAYVQRA